MAETIAIDRIRINGGTQARLDIDERTVNEYKESMMNGEVFPAIIVFHDGKDHWLADGFHRYYATRMLGKPEIAADVRQGTLRDAILYSVGANAAHGLRRSNADKRRAVERLLLDDEWQQWSDRAIAEKAKVSHVLVGNVRRDLAQTGKITSSDQRKTADGRVMKTGNIGKKASEWEPYEPEGWSRRDLCEVIRGCFEFVSDGNDGYKSGSKYFQPGDLLEYLSAIKREKTVIAQVKALGKDDPMRNILFDFLKRDETPPREEADQDMPAFEVGDEVVTRTGRLGVVTAADAGRYVTVKTDSDERQHDKATLKPRESAAVGAPQQQPDKTEPIPHAELSKLGAGYSGWYNGLPAHIWAKCSIYKHSGSGLEMTGDTLEDEQNCQFLQAFGYRNHLFAEIYIKHLDNRRFIVPLNAIKAGSIRQPDEPTPTHNFQVGMAVTVEGDEHNRVGEITEVKHNEVRVRRADPNNPEYHTTHWINPARVRLADEQPEQTQSNQQPAEADEDYFPPLPWRLGGAGSEILTAADGKNIGRFFHNGGLGPRLGKYIAEIVECPARAYISHEDNPETAQALHDLGMYAIGEFDLYAGILRDLEAVESWLDGLRSTIHEDIRQREEVEEQHA